MNVSREIDFKDNVPSRSVAACNYQVKSFHFMGESALWSYFMI